MKSLIQDRGPIRSFRDMGHFGKKKPKTTRYKIFEEKLMGYGYLDQINRDIELENHLFCNWNQWKRDILAKN